MYFDTASRSTPQVIGPSSASSGTPATGGTASCEPPAGGVSGPSCARAGDRAKRNAQATNLEQLRVPSLFNANMLTVPPRPAKIADVRTPRVAAMIYHSVQPLGQPSPGRLRADRILPG